MDGSLDLKLEMILDVLNLQRMLDIVSISNSSADPVRCASWSLCRPYCQFVQFLAI